MDKEQKKKLSANIKQFNQERGERREKRTFIFGPEYTLADLKKAFEAGWDAHYDQIDNAFAPVEVKPAFDKYMKYGFKKAKGS